MKRGNGSSGQNSLCAAINGSFFLSTGETCQLAENRQDGHKMRLCFVSLARQRGGTPSRQGSVLYQLEKRKTSVHLVQPKGKNQTLRQHRYVISFFPFFATRFAGEQGNGRGRGREAGDAVVKQRSRENVSGGWRQKKQTPLKKEKKAAEARIEQGQTTGGPAVCCLRTQPHKHYHRTQCRTLPSTRRFSEEGCI